MRELSTWSHSTYVIISAGALLDLPIAERTPETIIQITKLFDVLPSLFGMKRLMGDPPTTDESSALSLASYGVQSRLIFVPFLRSITALHRA